MYNTRSQKTSLKITTKFENLATKTTEGQIRKLVFIFETSVVTT